MWTHLASDYTYDELGHGNDLPLPQEVPLSDDSATTQVGYWGELLVYQYLSVRLLVFSLTKSSAFLFKIVFLIDRITATCTTVLILRLP